MTTWQEQGINISNIRGEQTKTICPRCSHNRKKKKDPCLSVNLKSGVWNCFNCGWNGSLHMKSYTKPDNKINISSGYSEGFIKYFKTRGISEDTLKFMKVSEGIEWMPGHNEINTIQFNYFRNNELINTKFRGKDKSFKLVKDAEIIFYNLDSIQDETQCVITEGEIDCLSYVEAGLTNVVSVPNGATKGSKLDFVENCKHYFETKEKIYLSIDNDEAGQYLREELMRRFGVDKCYLLTYPDGCKDANDVLVRHGADKLREVLYSAKSLPVNDVIYVTQIWENLLDEFRNGLVKGSTTYFPQMDAHFNWLPGEITLLHGIPNHGKSKFLKQLCLIKSVKENFKWAIFTPEEYPPTYFYSDLAHTLIGKNVGSKYKNQCSEDEFINALNFIKEHFFYIYPTDKLATPEFINKKFKELILREGINGGVIDPFNQLDNNFESARGRDDHYLSDFISREKHFALNHNFIKVIVAHPKGLKKNIKGNYDCPDAYDLNGGAMWFNKCDNILAYHRPEIKDPVNFTKCEIQIQKIKKQTLIGVPGTVTMSFDLTSNRFVDEWNRSPFQNNLEVYSQQQII